MKKLPPPLLLVMVLTACANLQNFRAANDGMLGKTETELLAQLGAPKTQYLYDGNKQLVYRTQQFGVVPSVNNYQSAPNNFGEGQTTGTNYTKWCEITYTIKNAKVTAWHAKGNNCRQ